MTSNRPTNSRRIAGASPRARVVLTVVCGVVALSLSEWIARIAGPTDRVAIALLAADSADHPFEGARFALDPDLTFRPINRKTRDEETGTWTNAFDRDAPPGVTRLLFIGDSVTRRGTFVDAIQERLGAGFECWNAGVEAYNTVQEVMLLERRNLAIKPDHVVLTFHINDYLASPTAFVDADGALVVCSFGHEPFRVDREMFSRWHLFRLLTWPWRARLGSVPDRDEHRQQIDDSLARLKELSQEHGFALTVLIHPMLTHRPRWKAKEIDSHKWVRRTLRRQGIQEVDLWPVMVHAVEAGVDMNDLREKPNDTSHPSARMGELIADEVIATWRREGKYTPAEDRPSIDLAPAGAR